MPLIKMATAARRARMGSSNTIRRALVAAGVKLVTLSPGAFAVEEEDLSRFLENRPDPRAAVPPARPKPAGTPHPAAAPGGKPKIQKRRQ
jgi:hypothetical protein